MMSQQKKLDEAAFEDAIAAEVAIECILCDCIENMLLRQTGLVSKTFDEMNSYHDLLDYYDDVARLIETGVVDEDELFSAVLKTLNRID